MNKFLFFSTLIAFSRASTLGLAPGLIGAPVAGASYLVRAPAHDSASIEHHRLGGNFAYSTAEAHAFASITPQISTLTHPVAETTHTHIPAPIATFQPAPVIATHHVAQPIFQDVPVHRQVPVTGPVRTHQTVHQPIVHETRTHTVQAVTHAVAAPVAIAHAAPLALGYEAYGAAPLGYANAAYAAAPLGYADAHFAHGGYAAAPLGYAGAHLLNYGEAVLPAAAY